MNLGWQWGNHGFLRKLGLIDFAGSGAVHLLGGVAGLVATLMLGPRYKRYERHPAPEVPPVGNPTNVMIGAFILW